MDRRFPSTSSALDQRSSIRHRSGAYTPRLPHHSDTRRDFETDHGEQMFSIQVEDPEALNGVPTVALVKPSRASTPYSPTSPPNMTDLGLRPSYLALTDDYEGRAEYLTPSSRQDEVEPTADFSPVPLTPRAPQLAREMSDSSLHTTVSGMSPLPTPNFASRTGGALRPYFPHFLQRKACEEPHHLDPPQSFCMTASPADNIVADLLSQRTKTGTVRPALVPSFSTCDKFTQKFPRPRSVKNPMVGRGPKSAFAANMLEEGEGLGMETFDRWTIHKWCLLVSVCTVLVYGLAGLVCAVLTWFRAWDKANVMYVADYDILVLITLSSATLLLTFLIGTSGTILNSRPILAVYAILLWPALISILAIGYMGYKRYTYALDRKLNLAWSEWYTPLGRLIIQNALRCCGYYDALHEATASKQCYPRTLLPGCKAKLYRFEHENLWMVWSTAFALVPVHIVNIFASLLCANHVTRTFGKGIMPKRYWLNGADVRADAERLMTTSRIYPVVRPSLARASAASTFREDREDNASLLNLDHSWCLPDIRLVDVPLRCDFDRDTSLSR